MAQNVRFSRLNSLPAEPLEVLVRWLSSADTDQFIDRLTATLGSDKCPIRCRSDADSLRDLELQSRNIRLSIQKLI